MDETPQSLGKTFLTGLALLLPLFIILLLLFWLFELITGAIAPISNLVSNVTGMPSLLGDGLVLVSLIAFIFFIGVAAQTAVGRWLHPQFDMYMQRVAPGYRMIREIVQHLFGRGGESPFAHGSVALVKLYGPTVPLTATAIVTSRHENGTCTVFVPTGPNPTSGFIYHVAPELVQLRPDIRVDQALRTVIACGMGANELFGGPPPVRLDESENQPTDLPPEVQTTDPENLK